MYIFKQHYIFICKDFHKKRKIKRTVFLEHYCDFHGGQSDHFCVVVDSICKWSCTHREDVKDDGNSSSP